MARQLYYRTANKSKTKTGILTRVKCKYCSTVDVRWTDDKINCSYCGELI